MFDVVEEHAGCFSEVVAFEGFLSGGLLLLLFLEGLSEGLGNGGGEVEIERAEFLVP